MKDETVIKLARFGCGTALLITYAVTKIDGMIVMTAMVLLGIPVELLKREVKAASQES